MKNKQLIGMMTLGATLIFAGPRDGSVLDSGVPTDYRHVLIATAE